MNEYSIIKANVKKNKKDILNILVNNLEGNARQKFEWNYYNCPFGKAKCWVVKHEESNAIVGSASLLPRKVSIKGDLVLAGVAADFAVNKEHRALGPAIQLQREIQAKLKDNGINFIYGVPNNLSKPLFLRIGHKKLGKIEKYIKILKTERLSKEYLLQRFQSKRYSRLINWFFSSKAFLRTLDFFIKIRSKETYHKNIYNYSIESPDHFDERFDVFWKKVAKKFNILGERTSDFLNWRYKKSSLHDYKIFILLNNEKDIVGYIIYYFADDKYYIVDMLFFYEKKVLDSLLAEFARYAREKDIGAIVVDYLGNSQFMEKLTEFKFLYVKKDTFEVFVYSPESSDQSKLYDKNNWHFFNGDYDI